MEGYTSQRAYELVELWQTHLMTKLKHMLCVDYNLHLIVDIKSSRILVGVIELNREEILLVAQTLHGSLGTNDVA